MTEPDKPSPPIGPQLAALALLGGTFALGVVASARTLLEALAICGAAGVLLGAAWLWQWILRRPAPAAPPTRWRLVFEGVAFLVYLAGVGALIWWVW